MSTYDPEERRETALAARLVARIRREGPMPVDEFMRACLYDPQHGYYVTRRPIGAQGDFVTAPEISQVFGELLGLWCVVVWQQLGAPSRFDLVEYGPGRGTLMSDALRAAGRVPAFIEAARVRLVEVSPTLREVQRATLRQVPTEISWHPRLPPDREPGPVIAIANEVLDAEVVLQVTRGGANTSGDVRCVGVDQHERLQFYMVDTAGRLLPDRPADIVETRVLHPLVAEDLAGITELAALLIDYGDTASDRRGSTLQAVRNHRYEHPLTSPGEADLTAQVDFGRLAQQCRGVGLEVDGPITQAELLGALGIAQRASRLMAANPVRAADIEAGVARLMSPTGMGAQFKAIGLRTAKVPLLPGFPPRRAAA